MKSVSLTFVVVLLLTAGIAHGQSITASRTASPAATVSQTIGISTVTVRYSRPAVRDRQIWGTLVPYGWNKEGFGSRNEAPWRSGANENTVIEFSHAAKVQGKDVPAGSYGIFFVINNDNTGEVILSKDYRSWGSFWYDPARDQLRSNITVREIPHTEDLTYAFINIGKNSADLVLSWEKKQFPVKIEFAVDDIVIANAIDELKGPAGFSWQGYNDAASYALENNVHLEQGLKWAEQAVRMSNTFTTLSVKAGILKQMGKTAEGEKAMQEGLAKATEGEINLYGYQLLGQGKIDDAINVFIMNTKRNPKSANVWDSLGEAYAVKGDKENAIKTFRKALSMNPPDNVRANSEKYLKQLGAL